MVLDITRRAIFEQGQGFDPQPENFGNQSGEALKFMYSLLEMKVGLMETEFRLGFAKLIRAICRYCQIPCGNIRQVWKRTCIRNDRELAEMCRNSVGILSQATILAHHPFCEDVQEELKQLEKEEREAAEKENIYKGAFHEEEKDSKGSSKEEDGSRDEK